MVVPPNLWQTFPGRLRRQVEKPFLSPGAFQSLLYYASLFAQQSQIISGIDIVVNNVGISPYFGPLMSVDRERFSKTLISNTWPALGLVQEAVAAGLGAGGAVLNISTIGARQVQPYLGPYVASKSALDSLTKLMARELGRRGIRVNGIAPGLIRTKTSRAISAGDIGDREAEILPLGRLGEPDDIASAGGISAVH